jgi:hypothetical protein
MLDEQYVETGDHLKFLCVPRHLSAPLMFAKKSEECAFACEKYSSSGCASSVAKHMCEWSSDTCKPKDGMYDVISVANEAIQFSKAIRDRADCIELNPRTK